MTIFDPHIACTIRSAPLSVENLAFELILPNMTSESVFDHILPFVSVAALSKDAINFISLSVFVYCSDWPKEFWFLIG